MNNRQIKFRIWDKARNKWLPHSENSLHAFTDYFLTFDGKIVATQGEICDHPNMEYQTNFDWCDYSERPFKITRGSERFVIQQYTGLKDKNKREIYEGDIVKESYKHIKGFLFSGNVIENSELEEPIIYISEIKWCPIYTGFMVERKSNTIGRIFPRDTNNLEVIGNIFENPDLLK